MVTSEDQSSIVSGIPGVEDIFVYPPGSLKDPALRREALKQICPDRVYASAYYLAAARPAMFGYRHVRRLTESVRARRHGLICDCGFEVIDNLTLVRKIYEALNDIWSGAGLGFRMLGFAFRQRGM